MKLHSKQMATLVEYLRYISWTVSVSRKVEKQMATLVEYLHYISWTVSVSRKVGVTLSPSQSHNL
jgi:hypothetical protein